MTKLSTTPYETRSCRSPREKTILVVPSMQIGWLEADFRRRSATCRVLFLQYDWRKNRSTNFGLVPVSNIDMTGFMEERWILKLRRTLYFHLWNTVTGSWSFTSVLWSNFSDDRTDGVLFDTWPLVSLQTATTSWYDTLAGSAVYPMNVPLRWTALKTTRGHPRAHAS